MTDKGNRLLSDGKYRYAYDAEGNRTTKFIDVDKSGTLSAGDTDITLSGYDQRNRLVAVSHVNVWTATQAGAVAAFTAQDTAVPGSDLVLRYSYDYADRRIRRSMDADGLAGAGQASVSFAAYAGDVRTLEIAQTATVSAGGRVIGLLGKVVERNFYGNGEDEILAVDKITWTGTTPTTSTFWTFADHQGTIRDIVSGNAGTRGQVVEHRQYDSFGKVLARTANLSPGAATLPGSGVGVAFGYTGRPIDEKTGLSDYRARWYDANTGRFINEDPSGFAGGDTNLFRYVGNDPLDRVDPSGLTAKWAGYGGKGSVSAAGFGAYGAGGLLTSGASNSTPTPFVMARAKSSPSYESPVWSGTKAFFGSISDSIVGGVTGLVTGEAGRQLGERAFQITVNNNGGKFNGQWGQVGYNIAGQMAGTHAMAEGMEGIDLGSHAAVAAEDRVGRFAGGLGQFAGIAAGGAGMTRSAFGASAFTNLPGSAAVSRVSSSINSAAGRVWGRVDDSAWVGNNAAVGPGPVMRTLVERLEANAARRLAEIQANSGPSSHFFTRHGAQTSIEQQFDRATTGLTPDGFKGNLVDSSRFLSHRAQLNAVQAAEGIFYRTGKKVFTFDAGYEIGEGFTRNATDLMRTTNVTAVFNVSGNIKTLFPSLSPHP